MIVNVPTPSGTVQTVNLNDVVGVDAGSIYMSPQGGGLGVARDAELKLANGTTISIDPMYAGTILTLWRNLKGF